ncbi:MAG: S-methyl-5-thioribose-1-phosphate isomerase [Candidatus Caenarcaniphilales bacterium]|nr:S-methyl-5-thioribose-1-phosphate isomerase [Candidatus Caenarcaniphilales bacterium]
MQKLKKNLEAISWDEDKEIVRLLDQRDLPYKETWIEIDNYHDLAKAIKDMVLRGAPLIGISAAYGMALAAKKNEDFCVADQALRETRPTAVNLMWALDQIQAVIQGSSLDDNKTIYQKILTKAKAIHQEDLEACKKMSEIGAEYIKEKTGKKKLRIMTHCNAGALATGGYGTALGVIRKLHEEDLVEMVYSNETRPRQQGSRLTAWELAYEGIPVTMLSDNMAAHCMKHKMIDLVIVGADRITANGDAANKIGTYQVAIVAKHHDVPFFVAAPESTIDRSLASGDLIPIEQRNVSELHTINGDLVTASSGVDFFNPGFDVTPNELIEAIFTEKGIFK